MYEEIPEWQEAQTRPQPVVKSRSSRPTGEIQARRSDMDRRKFWHPVCCIFCTVQHECKRILHWRSHFVHSSCFSGINPLKTENAEIINEAD